jgi:GntR family transcriptional repressor for pyruvate dehydrogenase complex
MLDRTVSKENSSTMVYSTFLDLLRKGDFLPSEKLPNERELASILNTSRTTIRDALLIAQQQGLIERKVGSGTYLSEKAPQIIEVHDARVDVSAKKPVSFHEVLEARIVMEPGVAALAAEHHDARDLAKINKDLNGIRQAKTWLEFKESLYGLFLDIYRASGNSLLLDTFCQIVEARRKDNYDGRRLESRVSELVRHQTHDEIAVIVEAIAARDSKLAEKETHDYLTRMFTNITI